MSKPKKIKAKMPAPERRNLIQLNHVLNAPSAGSHKDHKKLANKANSRKKYDNEKDGW
jgi:hypothetical protein